MRPDVIVDHELSDDAAVVRGAGGRDLVLTADVIAPLVDDPDAFGAIAAANAMSDVWAMGGEPRFALNLVFFPSYEAAMENSNMPETGELAGKLAALTDGEPTFLNLDIIEDREA